MKISRLFLGLSHNKINYTNFDIPELINPYKNNIKQKYILFNEVINLNQINWKKNRDKLKIYHLHYFDFLKLCDEKKAIKIITKWIQDNPASLNNDGWEPYPLSLRIVNWILYFSKNKINPDKKIVDSLYLQGRWLYRQLEFHLQANHLLKNIVALLYWSSCFNDNKLNNWAKNMLFKQIREQFSKGGFHFEYSPTYHAICINDILDCYNLFESIENNISNKLLQTMELIIGKGLYWINRINYNNQYIAVGDINYQDCPKKEDIESYADRLNVMKIRKDETQNNLFPVMKFEDLNLLLINSPFSPEYNTGHSHQDKLSILLYYKDKPVLVDTGNYSYKNNKYRHFSRSIRAHNTIKVDDYEQAETWGVFRVGYRGRVERSKLESGRIKSTFKHKYYKHTRIIERYKYKLVLKDDIIAKGKHSFNQYFHFHPDRIIRKQDNQIIIDNKLVFKFEHEPILKNSDYFPAMYNRKKNTIGKIKGDFFNSINLITEIEYL